MKGGPNGVTPVKRLSLPSDWTLILGGILAMNAGLAAYSALYTNFVSDDLHIRAVDLGLVESLREVPGFLTVVLAALTVRVRESHVTAAALLVMGLGMMSYIWAHDLTGLIAASLFWSLGFHLFAPLSNGLILSQAKDGKRGKFMGQSNMVAAIGTLLATLLVLAIVKPVGLRNSFIPTGAMILVGAICLLLLRDKEEAPRVRIVFCRRYLTYYTLTMLDGSRRQIFSTFALFLLVRIYHVDVRTITILLLFNTVVTMVSPAPIGRIIDRFGERGLLIGNYILLTGLFAGYALVHTVFLLGVLFCIDNMLFGCSSAITTYLGRIAAPGELTRAWPWAAPPTTSPPWVYRCFGGIIWSTFGYQVTFFVGAATCIVSVLVSLSIRMAGHHATVEIAQ